MKFKKCILRKLGLYVYNVNNKYVQKQKRKKKFFKGETIKLKLNVSNLFFK